jgi:hypothetical protein
MAFASAVIGMSFMVLSFPITGKLAQLVNDVQTNQMKRTDERIQTISESTLLSYLVLLWHIDSL